MTWSEEGLLWLVATHHSSEAKQGRQEVKAKTYWHAPPGVLGLLLYRIQDGWFRDGSATVSWALPHQSSVKKMQQRLVCKLIFWDIFSTAVCSSKMTLVYFKVT